jgi:zinc protease
MKTRNRSFTFVLTLSMIGTLMNLNGHTQAEMKTTLIPSPDSPLIAFRILVHTGSIYDPPGKEGLNTLTSYMLAYGGTEELTYQEVIKALYPMAASIDVQADKEVTAFIGDVHKDHLQGFYSILSDLILHPRFDPGDFERNKDQLLNYIQKTLRGTDDEDLGKEALNILLYENHSYGHPNEGTVQGLTAITLDDVKDFYKRMYTKDRIKIGLAGGYPDGFIEKIQNDFETLPKGKIKPMSLPEPESIEGVEVLLVEKPGRASAISIGCPIEVTRADDDFYALMVANSYLGEHRMSVGVLYNTLREARGLNYGDYSYIENFIQGMGRFARPNIPRRQQFFSIWIRPVAQENALFSLKAAIKELRNLVENGLSEDDFELSRQFVLNYSKQWTQTLSRRLGYQMDSEFYDTQRLMGEMGTDFEKKLPLEYQVSNFIANIDEKLRTLTVDDVNAAVQKYLQFENLKVAMTCEDAMKVKEALLTNAVTPITYQDPGSTPPEILEADKIYECYPLNVTRVDIIQATKIFER